MRRERVCRRHACGRSLADMRVDAVWCSRACYIRAWREGNRDEPPTRRPTRNGYGVRLYLSQIEAELLAQGRVPGSVIEKIEAKLTNGPVCVYCGRSEGHSSRCSVTKFGVEERVE